MMITAVELLILARPPHHRKAICRTRGLTMLRSWRAHAGESIMDVNDGIVSGAGIAEGFASAGVSTNTLLIAGFTTMLAGGCAAAGARYTEVRTEWVMNRAPRTRSAPASMANSLGHQRWPHSQARAATIATTRRSATGTRPAGTRAGRRAPAGCRPSRNARR